MAKKSEKKKRGWTDNFVLVLTIFVFLALLFAAKLMAQSENIAISALPTWIITVGAYGTAVVTWNIEKTKKENLAKINQNSGWTNSQN